MSLEGRVAMNMPTNRHKRHSKGRQWLWFVGLWLLGFLTVLAMTYPIKILIHSLM